MVSKCVLHAKSYKALTIFYSNFQREKNNLVNLCIYQTILMCLKSIDDNIKEYYEYMGSNKPNGLQ